MMNSPSRSSAASARSAKVEIARLELEQLERELRARQGARQLEDLTDDELDALIADLKAPGAQAGPELQALLARYGLAPARHDEARHAR